MRRPAVNIRPYMSVDGRGHFTPERIWRDNKGHVLYQRLEPRASFADHVLQTPWVQLQRLYFVSYTLWNYFNTPFLLTQPGFEVSELAPHEENWRCLHVRFPASVPTHYSEQILFFNQKGLLQRLDDAPEVVASTPVSHYCFDHQTFSGLIFPTLRRVLLRRPAGPALSGPTVTVLQIADVVVAADQSSQVWLRIKWINASGAIFGEGAAAGTPRDANKVAERFDSKTLLISSRSRSFCGSKLKLSGRRGKL